MPIGKIVRFLLLWWGAVGLLALAAYTMSRSSQPVRRDADQQAIYALLLDGKPCVMGDRPNREYNIYDSDILQQIIFRRTPPAKIQQHQRTDDPSQATIDDYIRQNQSGTSPLPHTCKTQPPSSLPYINVTNIGFNSEGTQALVAIEENACSWCGGTIDLYYVVKADGRWIKQRTWTLAHLEQGRP